MAHSSFHAGKSGAPIGARIGVSVPTSLYFQVDSSHSINREIFLQYLYKCLKLRKRKVEVRLLSFCYPINGLPQSNQFIEAKVEFPSIQKAKKSLRNLNKANGNFFTVSMIGFQTDSLAADIQRVQTMIKSKQPLYFQHHQQKIALVEGELLSAKTKNLDLLSISKQTDHIEALKARKEELVKQSREYIQCCNKMLSQLTLLHNSIHSTRKPIKQKIQSIQTEFFCECSKFQTALPIYARRQEIIERIKASPVSIVIGETGSGKSTQLVQYLYEAGFADQDKLIACTQPRKVAASSLAEHVSGEMCCAKNSLVIAKLTTTQKHKEGAKAKIVYLTDHMLLNECIEDRAFSKYSCIVIDEAHERSLHTDLLLAFIKQCLPLRPDLKVIITSATIDPQLFVNYFSNDDPHAPVPPIVRVSGRTYPVEVTWHPLSKSKESLRYPSMPYVEEAVQCAYKIHKSNEKGAILVFLTSISEIEIACNMMTELVGNAKVVVLPLHGRLQPAEQNKVFKVYDEGLRKIVFSTNVAETSITIPDVKHIVDSGYAKEMCFDPKRNMNSLEVRRISKSSAEQRKGRAGRVSAGTCYRLYSEEEYKAMDDRGLPEILRVHLTHAVLKLVEFGVPDVRNFDFVEMPDVVSLEAAVKMLQFLGAFDANGGLSDTGKKLALFPIDPQLGKIILDAINEDVVLEAVVSTAISSIGGNVFYRGQTDDMKAEGDKQKVKFIHHGGSDQLTALNVYKEWVGMKKEMRNKWCVDNSINAKSMRLVEETAKELFQILSTQMNVPHPHVKRPQKTPNIDTAGEKVVKLYFRTFIWNLAVNFGHKKESYTCLESPDQKLVLFPGSSPVQLNDVPQYLIYEKTLKLTQQFLLQVVPVEKEWIDEALFSGLLSREVFEKVEKYRVQECTIANLGSEVLRRTIKKKKELVEGMKVKCGSWRVDVDVSPERGIASLYCQAEFAETLKHDLVQEFNSIKKDFKAETAETGVSKPEDDVKLVLGSGGCIQFVLMPYNFHTIVIKGPLKDDWTEGMKQVLCQYSELVSYVKKQFSKETRVYAKFANPEDAEKALKLSYVHREDILLQPQLNRGQRGEEEVRLFRLQADLNRRKRILSDKNFAFVEFDSSDDLHYASGKLCFSPLSIRHQQVVIKHTRPNASRPNCFQLFIPSVPTSVTEEQLKESILARLNKEMNIEIKFQREPPFETTPNQLDALRKQLNDIVLKYATKGQFNVNVFPPQKHHYTYRSYIDFNDPEEGERALNGLEEETIGGERLKVRPVLSSVTRLSNEVYEVTKSDLEYIKNVLPAGVNLKTKPSKNNWIVEICSGNIANFITAKKCINALVQPRVFECDSRFLNEYILSKKFRSELDIIEKDTEAVIIQNKHNMSLCIYGSLSSRKAAEELLQFKIRKLEQSGLKVHEINLRKPGMPRGLMRHLITTFNVDLSGILKIEQIRTASLDPRKQVLTILTNDDGLQCIETIIQEYSNTLETPANVLISEADTRKTEEIECCACFTDIDDLQDVFRLECCGHTYHYDCVKLQLTPNNITIPVTCASDECALPFVWQDFENLKKKKALSLYQLVNSSVKSYLGANRAKVRNCPTPNCSMIYKVTENKGTRFMCGDCGSHVCTQCHVQYHDGLTCKMYKASKDGEEELAQWLKRDSSMRKRCPNCSIPIEKIEGCNHMACGSCRVHICWKCLKYFNSSDGCYNHLSEEHGGCF